MKKTKNSYNLFGMEWYSMHCKQDDYQLPKATEINPSILHYCYEYGLFDTNGFYRHITVSDLLSLEKEDKIYSTLHTIQEFDKLFVLCDILPKNPTIANYMLETICHIMACIESETGKKAILSAYHEQLPQLNRLISEYNISYGGNYGRS